MEGKKISFGFMKTKKQDRVVTSEKKEYIECVEEKAIKIVGGEVIEDVKPLVIPMKPNTLITAEKLKEIAEKVENFDEPEVKVEKEEKNFNQNETLDQMVARELMEEAKKEKVVDLEKLVVPINVKPVMDGQAEATLDDYESVPVQEFGLAMLRGMGWIPGKDQSKYKQPQLRPKGLGLGADKVIKEKEKNKSSKDREEELSIVKNSFVKITTGKYSGYYGKVVSLDEDNGRVVVDITVKKETVSLNEFMMQPVTKSEFDKQSKVINTESYEQFKNKEKLMNSKGNNSSKLNYQGKEESTSKNSNDVRNKEFSNKDKHEERQRNDRKYSNGQNRSREDRCRKESSSSEEERSRHRKKNKKKYSSDESLNSESGHKMITRHHSSSDSSDSNCRKKAKSHRSKSSKEKRDIDKKRKGKKKKRDRDRSPNYKKHRK